MNNDLGAFNAMNFLKIDKDDIKQIDRRAVRAYCEPNPLLRDLSIAARKRGREILIEALRGGPQSLHMYCLCRVAERNMIEVLIYGSTMHDPEADVVSVLRMFARLHPFIAKLKQGETAHETS